jgi:hypothetical protein
MWRGKGGKGGDFMRNRRAAVVAAVLLIIFNLGQWPAHVRGQETPRMERPVWQVGDRWVSIGNVGTSRGRATWSVAQLGDFEGTQAYFLRRETDWTEASGARRTERFTQIRDLNLAPIGRLDEQGRVVFRRRMDWYKWPLVVGAQWTHEGLSESLERGNWVKRRHSVVITVRAGEEVTTPAGVFATVHVYNLWRVYNENGAVVDSSEEDGWLSPQARIWVRFRTKYGANIDQGELVEYAVSK